MKRIRQWWTEERAKVKNLPSEKRMPYIWSYYRLWIIGILVFAFVLVWGVHHYFTTEPDYWFFACFANTRADIGDGSEFWQDYADYAGYDLAEKNLEFNAQVFVDPAGYTAGNQYYQLLIAYLDSGTLDVLVMGREDLQAMGRSGRLMDLEDPRMQAILEQYQDRLIWAEPLDEEYGKDLVPVGIDLSGSILDEAYPEGAALGINAKVPHPAEVETFLSYLFAGAAG